MIRNHKISAIELAAALRKGRPHGLPAGWENSQGALEAHRLLAREFIAGIDPYPANRFQGRGIVICAGGHRLFTNAWVCVRMLRKVGCRLPVQFWYLGDCEMDEVMRGLVAPFGVDGVDGEQLTHVFPARILNGWELKPYAILHCPFEEVLLLDADNIVLYDPEELFETEPYREHGAIFWPDYGRLDRSRLIWKACEVEYRDEPEFESGQIVIDKKRCWEALNLTMHYNEHSDFYYRHIHGDKETFHLAFRRVQKSYAMPGKGIHALDATMCQHDFEGKRVFQHRNLDKWRLDGTNRTVAGFVGEDVCRGFLAELREAWCGKVHWNEVPNYLESSCRGAAP